MKVVNSEVEPGEAPVVNSRYSIVMATSKRARQLISNDWDPMIDTTSGKPLSIAVGELYQGKIKILTEEEAKRASEALIEPVIELPEEGAEAEVGEAGDAEDAEVEESAPETEE
jgi:DNA-directed RNA polymerase subunit omega